MVSLIITKQYFSVLHRSVILDAIQYFSEAMQEHFGADAFEHQVSFVSKNSAILIATVSSTS